MIRLLEASNQRSFLVLPGQHIAYLAMLLIALKTSAAHHRKLESQRSGDQRAPLAPPITIIAPLTMREVHSSGGKKSAGDRLSRI